MSNDTLTNAQKRELENHLNTKTESVSEDDIAGVLEQEEVFQKKSTKLPESFWSDLSTMWQLMVDYYHGIYRETPWKTIAMIIVAILYLINPIDLIPDVIPIVGFIDDALIFSLTLKAIKSDLEAYKFWKNNQL